MLCSLHLHALRSPTCGSYRIASCCSPTLAPAATQTAAHSRLTLTLSSLAHDASVGFHAVNDAMNSPLGQFAMDLGGDIPGPIGTGFHVVSAADDLCVMRGCVACMPLLLCGCCCVAANTPAGTTATTLAQPPRPPRLWETFERCRQYDRARMTSTMPESSAPHISLC